MAPFDFSSLKNLCLFCEDQIVLDPPSYIHEAYYTYTCPCGAEYHKVPVSYISYQNLFIHYKHKIKVFYKSNLLMTIEGNILSVEEILSIKKLTLL